MKRVIGVYNTLRIHDAIGGIAPGEARRNPDLARPFVVAIQKAAIARAEERKARIAANMKDAEESA